MVEISLGLGKHPVVLEADQYRFRELLKARLLHQTFIVLGLSLVKMSICLLLLRVVQKRWQTQGLWGVFIFQGAFTIACELTLVSSSLLPHVKNYPGIYWLCKILQCFPVAAAWDYSLRPPPLGSGNAKCYSLEVFSAIGLTNGGRHSWALIHIVHFA